VVTLLWTEDLGVFTFEFCVDTGAIAKVPFELFFHFLLIYESSAVEDFLEVLPESLLAVKVHKIVNIFIHQSIFLHYLERLLFIRTQRNHRDLIGVRLEILHMVDWVVLLDTHPHILEPTLHTLLVLPFFSMELPLLQPQCVVVPSMLVKDKLQVRVVSEEVLALIKVLQGMKQLGLRGAFGPCYMVLADDLEEFEVSLLEEDLLLLLLDLFLESFFVHLFDFFFLFLELFMPLVLLLPLLTDALDGRIPLPSYLFVLSELHSLIPSEVVFEEKNLLELSS